jgi:hypothetical protein
MAQALPPWENPLGDKARQLFNWVNDIIEIRRCQASTRFRALCTICAENNARL